MAPTESIASGHKTDEPRRYGMLSWRDLFSPRQLLCHGTSIELFRELLDEEHAQRTLSDITKAAFGYLALSLDKLRDYNSRLTHWHSGREVVAGTFDRHDFSFKWSYVEMAPLIVGLGYDWALEQTAKCIAELVDLVRPDIDVKTALKHGTQGDLLAARSFSPPSVTVTCRSADNLEHLEDESVDVIVMDPPYYDNVMYAGLSDFFYVWLKRTAGYVYPELSRRPLTDKDNEAVANPAKFHGMRGAKALAAQDYRERMAAIFAECRRVLKPDGIMTLMFTHKATGAWDAFGAPQFPYDEALRLARVVGVDLDHEIIGHLDQKKASDVLLWDSATRAAKGALGPPDGSRAMLDAVHHAAHTARTRTLDAARDWAHQ